MRLQRRVTENEGQFQTLPLLALLCSLHVRAMKWRLVKMDRFWGGDVSPRSGFGAFRGKFARRNALHFDSLLLVKTN